MGIEDLLKSMLTLKGENTGNQKIENPREIWEGIAEKKKYDELGFNTQEELQDFIEANPYSSLK